MAKTDIFIMTGETSGDHLGAILARELYQQDPQATISGVGGHAMQQAGVSIVYPAEKLAVIGVIEIIKKIPTLIQARQKIYRYLREKKPDCLVLIDYPGFNLRLARYAKQLNIPVFFYVSPQIWAWRYHRIHAIRRNVDHMAVLFAFEEKLYQREHIPVTHVGHPLMEAVHATETPKQTREKYQLGNQQPIIGMLPGSRHQEIQQLLPVMLASYKKLKGDFPELQAVLLLPTKQAQHPLLAQVDLTGVRIIINDLYNGLQVCDATITASGTVTLEVALLKIPQVIIYTLHPVTYWIAKKLVKIRLFGLCNIAAEKKIAPELIQKAVTASNIRQRILPFLNNPTQRAECIAELHTLQEKIKVQNGNHKVAHAVLSLIKKTRRA